MPVLQESWGQEGSRALGTEEREQEGSRGVGAGVGGVRIERRGTKKITPSKTKNGKTWSPVKKQVMG